MTFSSDLSNRPPLDGGFNAEAGPLLGDAIQAPNSNVIEFPSGKTLLPDSRAQSREPFIDDREFATCIFLGMFFGSWLVLLGLVIIGYRALIA